MATGEQTRDEPELVSRVVAGLSSGLAYCTVLLSPELAIEWVSPVSTHMTGWRPDELVGRNALDLLHPDDVASIERLAFANPDPLAFGVDPADVTTDVVRVLGSDGTYRSLELAANNQVANPDVNGYVMMLRDVTDQGLTIDVFRRMARGESLGSVVRAVAALLAWRIRGSTVEVTARDAAGQEHHSLIEPPAAGAAPTVPAAAPVELELDRDGQVVARVVVHVPGPAEPTEWCRTIVERSTGLLQLALARDADAARLRSAAHTDELTGVLNRAGLSAAMARRAGGGHPGVAAVLYIDLDDFKNANDQWGHVAGDAVLVETARRLRRCMRSEDLVARPGGDEFVVVCMELPDAGTARALATRVLAALSSPVMVGEEAIECTASVGLAIASVDEIESLFARADAALLAAKRDGKARLVTDG